ncbi:Retrovirus-related Pol polyprotein from transposon TNT 1-94 [Vitis vinifera]|uniref:Retrovirus-related Pol polyprotein from transposon TNT 1-94 n=1 Tax=Vitis vinifera TaxID=29760 RepID=A0A438HZE7_VITVI|nr:Retrovirus-related Pol polyprotein from transposon TNT 1-94 [Vitis vinifera]
MGMMWPFMAMLRWEDMECMAWCRERKGGKKESEWEDMECMAWCRERKCGEKESEWEDMGFAGIRVMGMHEGMWRVEWVYMGMRDDGYACWVGYTNVEGLHGVYKRGRFFMTMRVVICMGIGGDGYACWVGYMSMEGYTNMEGLHGYEGGDMHGYWGDGYACWVGYMSMEEPQLAASQSDSLFSEFTAKMTEALTKVQPPTLTTEPSTALIGIKLDGTNYVLWSQVVEMYISGKDKLDISMVIYHNHLRRIQHFENGALTTPLSKVYDLRRHVTQLKQTRGSLEKYYNDLQGLWREIDFRRPNLMEYAVDIHNYNLLLQEDRVYVFLDGLDDRLDKIRGDVLQLRPFPTVEQAYAHVRREALRQYVMITSSADAVSGAVLATKGLKLGSSVQPPTVHNGRPKSRTSSEGLKCSHCGNSKHTRDTCFKLHGYPDWWNDLRAKKGRDAGTKDEGSTTVVVATAEPQLSFIPHMTMPNSGNCGYACYSSTNDGYRGAWLLDSGATDHMTFTAMDFTTTQVTSDLNCIVLIYPTFCLLQDILTKEIIGRGTKRGGLYYMEDLSVGRAHHTQHTLDVKEKELWLWHRWLGHPSFTYMKHLFPDLFSQLKNFDFQCETCILAKSHRASFPLHLNKKDTPFALIHSDVWGPSPITTVNGFKWFVLFVDDCTRMTWLYLLKHKDEVLRVFKSFHAMVQTQFSAKVQVLGSDNGGEYVNHQFREYFQQHVGAHALTRFWADAVTTVVHLLNRMPFKVLDFQTPLQALSGYTAVPAILMLPPRETRQEEQNWTELNWPSVSEIHVEPRQPEHVSLATEHHEDDHAAHVTSPSAVPENPTPENDPEVSSFNTNILAPPIGYVLPNRHNRGKPPSRYSPDIEGRRSRYPIANYVSTKKLNEPLKTFVHNIFGCHIPTRVEEALGDPKWTQAIKDEMEALMKNKTWNLVPLPEGKKTVGCKVLISLAANLNWPLHQFDVKNDFLHGGLEEEVYMDIPPGYSVTTGTNEVCKLQRALYGLKQSPRAWFGRFSLAMKKYGFQQSNADHTLFLKKQQGKVTTLIVHVDDMVITGDDIEEISRLQGQLASEFEMKNLGGLKYFLGIEVARSTQGIFLSQRKYVLDLLSEVGLLECKPVDTPIVQNHKLGIYTNQKPTDKGRYQRLVGKLIDLSHTRPDIAYAVSVVSQFMHCPSEEHMEAVIRILRYLKSSPGKGLMFSKNDHVRVDGYTTQIGLGTSLIGSRHQEVEFRGMAKGLCELLWLKRLLTEIGFAPKSEMNLFCDNKAAIDISHNLVQHDRTKHVELADILTKAVSSKDFHNSLIKLRMKDPVYKDVGMEVMDMGEYGGLKGWVWAVDKRVGKKMVCMQSMWCRERKCGDGHAVWCTERKGKHEW